MINTPQSGTSMPFRHRGAHGEYARREMRGEGRRAALVVDYIDAGARLRQPEHRLHEIATVGAH
jgi:hypothetical protein